MPRRTAAPTLALAAVLSACVLAGCSGTPAATGEPKRVVVFAASSLVDSFELLSERFEQANPGTEVVVSFGGSTGLVQQLLQGAPADVLATADSETMALAASVAAEPVAFATNSLQLVVPLANPAEVRSIADLARPELAIALCAPEVPCGAAAQRLLEAAGVVAMPDTLEQHVRAVLTRVELGEADAGLVYRTDALGSERVEVIELPVAAAIGNTYQLAAVDGSTAGTPFIDYVLSAEGQSILEEAGFGRP